MSLAIVYSRASQGVDAPLVTVEVHISGGLPRFSIVGLAETAVKESKDRVRSALLNMHFEFPARRITVNLAPADLPKDGGRFDLPIAIGILAATKQIPQTALQDFEFAGELALSGELRPIHGALPFALATRNSQRCLILPIANANEANFASNLQLLPAQHLLDVCAHLLKTKALTPYHAPLSSTASNNLPDLADVRGQPHAKRALEIAAAGQHSLLMIGPPGTGKSMLASRLPGILPLMTEDEALAAAAVLSTAGKPIHEQSWRLRNFRAPHHTASSVALVGGGSPPQPGEISLAHHGVLFLDELPEYSRSVLEALREPLETGHVVISRASHQAQFPAKFQLIAAMNPCPCGYLGDTKDRCQCTSEQVKRYQNRISGPLLDRIDMQVEVSALPQGFFTAGADPACENSAAVQARVIQARELQLQRQNKPNTALSNKELEQFCAISAADQQLLNQAMERFSFSARAYHRILRVARTITDMAGNTAISTAHLSEALSYRCLDKSQNSITK